MTPAWPLPTRIASDRTRLPTEPSMPPTARTNVRRPARRGFSFAEVMFAVVILGIGFIMVAAIFPVALQQTQATSEENSASAAARGAAEAIAAAAAAAMPNPVGVTPGTASGVNTASPPPFTPPAGFGSTPLSVQVQRTVPTLPLFPPTVKSCGVGQCEPGPYLFGTTVLEPRAVPPAPIVVPFTGPRWDSVRANAVVPADPRFAYVAFYKRANGSNLAQVIVISVASRGSPTFVSSQLDGGVTDSIQTNPAVLNVSYTHKVSNPQAGSPFPPAAPLYPSATAVTPDVATLSSGAITYEGGYVTVAGLTGGIGSTLPPSNQDMPPYTRTYQLGRSLGGGTYELLPGGDLTLAPGTPDGFGVASWGRTYLPVSPGFPSGAGVVRDAPYSGSVVRYTNGPLQPSVGYVTLASTANAQGGQMAVYADPYKPDACQAAVPGAFVIIADDFPYDPNNSAGTAAFTLPFDFDKGATVSAGGVSTAAQSFHVGRLNGRIFRLGSLSTDHLLASPGSSTITAAPLPNTNAPQSSTFDLDPSYAMRPIPGDPYQPQYSPDTMPNPDLNTVYSGHYAGLRARAYILAPPVDPTTGVRGTTAQDVGCYSLLVPVR